MFPVFGPDRRSGLHYPNSARVPTVPTIPTSSRTSDFTSTCRNGTNLASPTLSAWLHHPVKSFRKLLNGRESTETPGNIAQVAMFSSPETVAAYVERLDTTTLAFAIDAAYIVDVVPPRQGSEYVILDNACGTGAAVEWIVNEFDNRGVHLDITATDHSAVMMNEVAKRRERLNWDDNVKSIIMDAQALKFPVNTFTHVFMTFGIMLIPDYMGALKSIHHVLQKNGQLAITSWKVQGHWNYLVRAARIVLQNPKHPPPRFFDERWLSGDYIAKLLKKVGFRNVQVHERTHMWEWTSREEFIQFVGRNKAPSIRVYMAKWTAQQKEDVQAVIRRLLHDDFPGTETFLVPMVANIVVGSKK